MEDLLMAVRTALAGIDVAYRGAVAQVDAEPDLDAAHAVAQELAGHMRDLSDQSAELRARIISKTWHAERLSLAQLGARYGISKTRADQLMKSLLTKEGKHDG